ncbi:hypothetical protein BDZ45DRAFT_736115 [Acephala macrosclerotiorum]|nr:hypothetical protein BDZ45DRAFT_736115 [Acephala macrosclerotiorum]
MGWPQLTVDSFDRNWWRYIGGCETHAQTQPHVVLRTGQFLSDVVDRVLFTELLGGIGGAGNRREEREGRSRRGWGDIRVGFGKDQVLVRIPGFHGIRIKADSGEDDSIVDNIWMACFFVLMVGVGSAFLVMSYIMLFYVGYDV